LAKFVFDCEAKALIRVSAGNLRSFISRENVLPVIPLEPPDLGVCTHIASEINQLVFCKQQFVSHGLNLHGIQIDTAVCLQALQRLLVIAELRFAPDQGKEGWFS
jgi:hypothetical protein